MRQQLCSKFSDLLALPGAQLQVLGLQSGSKPMGSRNMGFADLGYKLQFNFARLRINNNRVFVLFAFLVIVYITRRLTEGEERLSFQWN
jgi:hypothetical protein